jgi:hypothetical protein
LLPENSMHWQKQDHMLGTTVPTASTISSQSTTERFDPARAQQKRMDDFRQMLSGDYSLSDPVNSAIDTTRQSIQPVLPKPIAVVPSRGASDFLPTSISLAPGGGGRLGSIDEPARTLRPSGMSPSFMPPTESRTFRPPTANFEVPRRAF